MPTPRSSARSKASIEVKSSGKQFVVTNSTTSTSSTKRKRSATIAAASTTTIAVVKKKVKVEGLSSADISDAELTEEDEEEKAKTHTQVKEEEEEHKCDLDSESAEETEDETSSKPKKKKKASTGAKGKAAGKSKAKGKKEENMLPIRARTPGLRMFLGAHISSAGGPQNAVGNSIKIGGNAFALFLKSQRKWTSKDLEPAEADAFKKAIKEANYDSRKHILPHGSYLVNLAQEEKSKQEQAYTCFLDDLKRCEMLNIGLYNFHPGSTLGLPRDEAISRIARMLNRAHKETSFVKTVLENMAGQGNVIGSKLEDLRDIISQVDDKSRMGVCVDTCHTFAAGFDLRTQETFDEFWKQFDEIIGLKYLVAMHINDSKAPLGSNRDLHQNIGLGFLGLEAFRLVVNKKELEGIPLILETPMKEEKNWADEIELLESLVGVAADDPEFLAKAAALSKKGEAERKSAMEAYHKKLEKDAKSKAAAEKKAGKQMTLTAMVMAKTTATATTKRVGRKNKDAGESAGSELEVETKTKTKTPVKKRKPRKVTSSEEESD